MAAAAAVCGIDLGTTAIKAVLVDADGRVLAQKGLPCPLYTGQGGVAEQDAEDWYTLAAACVKSCAEESGARVLALSISAQAGCLVPADSAGKPLGRALSWMDKRADGYATGLSDEVIYRNSGWRYFAGFNAAKLLWMRRHQPDIYSRAAFFLSTIDYVQARLCGPGDGMAIDPSNAALTQLYDIDAAGWSEEILGAIGLEKSRLPRVVLSGALVGGLTRQAAALCGLPQGTPVVQGGHDQYCAATGAGALKPGDTLVSMGTAWAVLGISGQRILDYRHWAASGSHVAPGRYGLMTTLTAGGALEWLRRTALGGMPLPEMDRQAQARREKAAGLYCLPHFTGISYPYWQDNARAAFVGLGLEHDAVDMALALMEGAAFDVRDKLEGYREMGFAPQALLLAGGGAKSALWTDILQAVCGLGAMRCGVTEAAALGAAALAGVHAGLWPGLHAAAAAFGGAVPCPAPPAGLADFYREKHQGYRRLVRHMQSFYGKGE